MPAPIASFDPADPNPTALLTDHRALVSEALRQFNEFELETESIQVIAHELDTLLTCWMGLKVWCGHACSRAWCLCGCSRAGCLYDFSQGVCAGCNHDLVACVIGPNLDVIAHELADICLRWGSSTCKEQACGKYLLTDHPTELFILELKSAARQRPVDECPECPVDALSALCWLLFALLWRCCLCRLLLVLSAGGVVCASKLLNAFTQLTVDC